MVWQQKLRGVAVLVAAACVWLAPLSGEAALPAAGASLTMSAAAPTVDGFAEVPWGATAEQIAAIMQDKGFWLDEERSTPDNRVYGGGFGGYKASVEFKLLNGVFFRGEARFTDDAETTGRWRSLDNMFTVVYGSPKLGGTKSEPVHIWDGLKTAVAGDDVAISLSEHFLVKKPCVVYLNKSLETRLKTGTAAQTDGFLGLPWGANAAQIDKAMAEKGFRFMGKDRGGDVESREYLGTFAGYPCVIHFSLKANAYFLARAEDLCCTTGTAGNDQVTQNARKMEMMISAIYGPPQPDQMPRDSSFYYVNWNNRQSPAGSDQVKVGMLVKLAFDETTKGLFDVSYINYSLRDRL